MILLVTGYAGGHGCGKARYSWMKETDMLPSPTLLATRLMDPERTSPAQKRPGTLDSRGKAGRSSCHVRNCKPVFT